MLTHSEKTNRPHNMALTHVSFLLADTVLALRIKSQSEAIEPKQLIAEKQLIDLVFTGEDRPLHRESLNQHDLFVLSKLESQNALLIADGQNYDTRQQRLTALANKLRGFLTQEQAA